MKRIILSLAGILVSASIASADTPDSKGCWDAKDSYGNRCIVQDGHEWRNGKIIVTYKNKCGLRIYAKVCQGKKTGSNDCGAFGLEAYRTRKYYTYNADGSVEFNAVGSTKPKYDWVCKSKYKMDVN